MGDSVSFDDGEVVEKDPSGRYIRYDEILGRGAFKTVYKAFDEVNGIEVAWNQMNVQDALQTPEQLERLYSEVHLLKSLKHENIIKCYHSWVDDQTQTINMITELFTSGCLRQYRKKHNNVDLKAIKNWARQILQGLNYLHSHDPPIIHRDLKCDNVFVNGHTGEVKIGDLGLAAIMQQPTARSVVGTPEFMAPELYDEEYTELVDIYSFGMCMLEMITCEYPYCECRNPAQIYRKVSLGIKPASLAKVDKPQVKEFIEKCLVPAAVRLPAVELLKDPFLATESPKEVICDSLQLSSLMIRQDRSLPSESLPMEIDTNSKKSSKTSCVESLNEAMQFLPLEVERCTENNGFRLRGEKNADNTISMTLRIADLCGRARNIHFSFFLESDTTITIAEEMVEQLELSGEDVSVIAGLIDSLIVKLSAIGNPSLSGATSMQDGSYGIESSATSKTGVHDSSIQLFANAKDHENGATMKSDITAELYFTGSSDISSNRNLIPADYVVGTDSSEISSDFGMFDEGKVAQYLSRGSSIAISSSDAPQELSLSSICSLSISDKEEHDELQVELAAIDMQYNMYLQQLSRMREEAMENAKRKWMAKKK
ncbi:Serine/threonine-protein kinase WNK8 [Linum perenne]